jgi:predicted dienelactone hydrolase
MQTQHDSSPVSVQRQWPKYLIALSLALSLTGLRPDAADAAEAGLVQWAFDYHDTSVPVAVWFPTSEPARQINAGPFTPLAASNAPLPTGPHPLVILSHGTDGSGIAHHPIAQTLAKNGFLVAALTHPGDNYQDRSLVADDRYFDERPRQLTALLQALISDGTLGVLIDRERIGAIGHSAGGYSVAVLAGARPNRQALIAHCTQVTDDPSCEYRDPSVGVTAATNKPFKLPEANAVAQVTDLPPIRSIALLAPLGRVIDETSSIAPDVAVTVISAQLDSVLPHRYHRSRLQKIAPHGSFREVSGAGHFSFIAPVEGTWKQQLGEVAEDPAGFNRKAFNAQLGQELTQWFHETLPVVNR